MLISIIFLLLSTIYASADLKWVKPTQSACTLSGGKALNNRPLNNATRFMVVISSTRHYVEDEGILIEWCDANWENAKKICQSSGARLPTLNELQRGNMSCIKLNDDNLKNSSHSSCYKKLGFDKGLYWSSTEYNNNSSLVGVVNFPYGNYYWHNKFINDKVNVMCIH